MHRQNPMAAARRAASIAPHGAPRAAPSSCTARRSGASNGTPAAQCSRHPRTTDRCSASGRTPMAAGGMRSPCDSRRECRRPTNGQGSSCAMGPAGGGPGWSECGVSLCGSAVGRGRGPRRGRAERRAPGKPRAANYLFEACIFWLCYDFLRCVHYYTRLCTGLPTHTAGTPGPHTQR